MKRRKTGKNEAENAARQEEARKHPDDILARKDPMQADEKEVIARDKDKTVILDEENTPLSRAQSEEQKIIASQRLEERYGHEKSSFTRLSEIISILHRDGAAQGMNPVKLRRILEDLGPTFVKIGQMMSTRADLFSKRYTDELAKLREDVSPLPYTVVMQVLEENYGDYHAVFSAVEEEPLGSASMAQVHRAWLLDGTPVVVKVKRPGIYYQMDRDVRLLRKATGLLRLSDVLNGVVDVNSVIDEFWETAKEEMDFEQEGRNCVRFYEENKDMVFIDCPHIYLEHTNKDILVMEYIDGYEIGDPKKLKELGYDPDEIADKLAYNYIDQIVNNGYFHADPHAGNIRIRGDKIVWMDFGMMSELSPRDKDLMKMGIRAIAGNNVIQLVDTILALGTPMQPVDYSQFTIDMERFMSTYMTADLDRIDIVEMTTQIFTICHHHHIQLPKGISMLARALMTIEGTLLDLDPALNIMRLITSHKELFSERSLKSEIAQTLGKVRESTESLIDLPVQAENLLKLLNRGQVKVNLNLLGSQAPLANLDRMVNRLVVCILIAALLLASSIICTTKMKPTFLDIPLLGFAGFFIAFCLSLWLFVKMLFLHEKNKPF